MFLEEDQRGTGEGHRPLGPALRAARPWPTQTLNGSRVSWFKTQRQAYDPQVQRRRSPGTGATGTFRSSTALSPTEARSKPVWRFQFKVRAVRLARLPRLRLPSGRASRVLL